ncbi:MAG: LysR family transcriptional regulator [Pseudomonadota bacterium]
MPTDLNALSVFCAVATTRSFRAAADRFGVTRSAVSQTVRKLEEQMGIALVHRTTRSVSLTEAGDRLYAGIGSALFEIETAVEAASDLRNRPRGLLRLAVSSIAESFISGPLLAGFLEANPDVTLDVVITDEEFDIVAAGYDAGVRLGDVIEQDMIAVSVSDDQWEQVACAPSYVARHGAPVHPRDLINHRCIGWRLAPEVAPHRWEFIERGREFDVAVNPEITTNDLRLIIRLALAGAGVTIAPDECLSPWLKSGELVPLLDAYRPRYPGFFLYYPNRRNLAPKLRALVDHVRHHRRRKAAARKR